MDEAVTLENTEISQGQVTAIEQFDLHLFIRRDVVGELHADLFPGRAAIDELVLQHPLHERFAHHWPGIVHAMPVSQLQAMFGAGHWRDAVDHGIGEAHIALDPVPQVGIAQGGERQQGLAGHRAVVRQVIAGHQGECRRACRAAFGQGGAQETEHGFRYVGVRQIVLDLRQVGHELAVAVIDAVTTLGDGQRNDADPGAGEFVDQRLGIVFGQQHVADGTDDAHLGVIAVTELEQGEQVVLCLQIIPGAAIFAAQADATNGPVQAFALVHQRIGVIRLVGAVETADANVRDALAGVAQGVGGHGNLGCEAVQAVFIEFHRRLSESGSDAQRAGKCHAVGIE
ncbi:hypothetical protein D3C76_809010 [compost metagenome]